jgi:hypothetical protein
MTESKERCLQEAVQAWAATRFQGSEVRVAAVDFDPEEKRYLVDYAVRAIGYWRVAEVWVEAGEITLVNDLGEGLPVEGSVWPWPAPQKKE